MIPKSFTCTVPCMSIKNWEVENKLNNITATYMLCNSTLKDELTKSRNVHNPRPVLHHGDATASRQPLQMPSAHGSV